MDNGYVTKADLHAGIQEIKEYVDQRTYEAETRLLRAFSDHNGASNVRLRKIEADVSNTDTTSTQRLGELERRVAELEIRLLKQEERPPR